MALDSKSIKPCDLEWHSTFLIIRILVDETNQNTLFLLKQSHGKESIKMVRTLKRQEKGTFVCMKWEKCFEKVYETIRQARSYKYLFETDDIIFIVACAATFRKTGYNWQVFNP